MALKVYDKLKHSVRFWLLRKLPTCQQTVQTISQSMERELTLHERILAKVHFWICSWCQWYMEHLHLIRDAARAKAAEPPDLTSLPGPALSSEARERLKRRLSGHN